MLPNETSQVHSIKLCLFYYATSLKNEFERVKDSVVMQPKKDLMEEHSNIGDLKKYNLTLQNIQLSPKVSSYLTGRKIENDTKCEEDDQK